MGPIEEIGLLKMDFLGLRNLDVIEDAVEIIRRSHGIEVDIEQVPMDDAKTYEMLARGDSIGVFQLESEGMREAMKKVKPTEFDDIVALVALYRPGAMRFIDDYAAGQAQPRVGPLPRPAPEADHRGDLRLLHLPGAADGDREADGRLLGRRGRRPAQGDREEEARPDGDDGGEVHRRRRRVGDQPLVAKDLWSLMTAAADYSFNSSHAACYALIAYRTAYLKANYPAEYMAAVISSVMSTKDKVPFFVNRCEEMGIEVLPPDVNTSDHGFVVSGNSIRFGLDAVKNVGHAAVQAILEAREEAATFTRSGTSASASTRRAVNKRAIECLVKCGALDSTGRLAARGCSRCCRNAQAGGQKMQEDALRGQSSIFDLGRRRRRATPSGAAALAPAGAGHPPVPRGEFDQRELLAMEKETLGTYVTSHPLSGIRDALREASTARWRSWRRKPDRSVLTIGGLVSERKRLRTRSGADMMFATLDDLEGQVEMLVFNQILEQVGRDHGARSPGACQGPPRPPRGRQDQLRRPGGVAVRARRGDGCRSRQAIVATGRAVHAEAAT